MSAPDNARGRRTQEPPRGAALHAVSVGEIELTNAEEGGRQQTQAHRGLAVDELDDDDDDEQGTTVHEQGSLNDNTPNILVPRSVLLRNPKARRNALLALLAALALATIIWLLITLASANQPTSSAGGNGGGGDTQPPVVEVEFFSRVNTPLAAWEADWAAGLGGAVLVANTTSTSPTAQSHFHFGTLLMHAFMYPEARAQFRLAQAADPRAVLPYAFELLSFKEMLWASQARGAALARLAEVRALNASWAWTHQLRGSDLELRWFAAVAELFCESDARSGADRAWSAAEQAAVGVQRYAAALALMAADYPSNVELQVHYALALMSIESYSPGAKERARALLWSILAREPMHPAALHYCIHAYDESNITEAAKGLPCAERFPLAVPYASHAAHMPVHLDFHLGLFQDALKQDLHAIAVSQAQCVLQYGLSVVAAAWPDELAKSNLPTPLTMTSLLAIVEKNGREGSFGDYKQFPSFEPPPMRLAVALCDDINKLHSYEWATHSSLQVGRMDEASSLTRSAAFVVDVSFESFVRNNGSESSSAAAVAAVSTGALLQTCESHPSVPFVLGAANATASSALLVTSATAFELRDQLPYLYRMVARTLLESMLWWMPPPPLPPSPSSTTLTAPPSPADLGQYAQQSTGWLKTTLQFPFTDAAFTAASATAAAAAAGNVGATDLTSRVLGSPLAVANGTAPLVLPISQCIETDAYWPHWSEAGLIVATVLQQTSACFPLHRHANGDNSNNYNSSSGCAFNTSQLATAFPAYVSAGVARIATLQSLIVAAHQSHTVVLALDVLLGQLQGMSLYIAATAVQTNFSSTQPSSSATDDAAVASLCQHMVLSSVALNDTLAAYTASLQFLLASAALEHRRLSLAESDSPSLDFTPAADQLAAVMLDIALTAAAATPSSSSSSSSAAAANSSLSFSTNFTLDLRDFPASSSPCNCECDSLLGFSSAVHLSAIAVPIRCFPMLVLSLLSAAQTVLPNRGSTLLTLARTWRLLSESGSSSSSSSSASSGDSDSAAAPSSFVLPGADSQLAWWKDVFTTNSSGDAAAPSTPTPAAAADADAASQARAWYSALGRAWNVTDASSVDNEAANPARQEVRAFLGL